jgi:hypothetical protein
MTGRSWFVNPDSLRSHKRQRYQKVNPRVQTPAEELDTNSTSPDSVLPPQNKAKAFLNKITWNNVKYEPDETELLPVIKKSVAIDVDPAEATEIDVREQSESVRMTPTELPAVSLNGTLKVASLDTYYEVEDSGNTSQADGGYRKQLQNDGGKIAMRRLHTQSKPVREQSKKKILLRRDKHKNKAFFDKLSAEGAFQEPPSKGKANLDLNPAIPSHRNLVPDAVSTLVPESVSTTCNQSQKTPKSLESSTVPVVSYRLVHLSIILSAIVLVIVLSLTSRVVSTATGSTSSIEFSLSSVSSWLLEK